MSYKLVSYDAGRGVRAVIISKERLIDVAEATGNAAYTTTLGVLNDWAAADPALAVLAADAALTWRAVDWNQIQAPLRPGSLYCAGSNYGDHMREMTALHNMALEPDPHTLGIPSWHFIKSTQSVTGPGASVAIPPRSKKIDWEIELVAVIGKAAKDVAVADALSHVAGYTVGNDLSARDLSSRPAVPVTSPFHRDMIAGKSFDGACPLGPWIVPASAVGDPQKLGLKLWVNGVLKQDSSTAEMIFTVAEQIADLSMRITLCPGDAIMTGTPAGVGAARNEFLKAGDELELWCERVGTLKHRMA